MDDTNANTNDDARRQHRTDNLLFTGSLAFMPNEPIKASFEMFILSNIFTV